MKNKKGFTLIELLAVIVILAIIALIAVPTIMTILDKANKSAFKDTAYGIISAGELYFAGQQLDLNGMSGEKIFDLSQTNPDLQLKGEVPAGTLKINEDGDIALAVSNGRYCVTKRYTDNDITIKENSGICYIPGTLLGVVTTSTDLEVDSVETCLTDRTTDKNYCGLGTAFAIKVKEEEVYKFYVIKDDGNKVTLIMDRNLGDRVAWYEGAKDNSYGPVTALTHLNDQTADWDNIDAIESYEYINNEDGTTHTYGYQKLEITNGAATLISQDGNTVSKINGIAKARLLTFEEHQSLTNDNKNIPDYLKGNLNQSNTPNPLAYWYLTAFSDDINHKYEDNRAYNMSYQTRGAAEVDRNTDRGVRPVIELPKY